jgi:hypothetical protein
MAQRAGERSRESRDIGRQKWNLLLKPDFDISVFCNGLMSNRDRSQRIVAGRRCRTPTRARSAGSSKPKPRFGLTNPRVVAGMFELMMSRRELTRRAKASLAARALTDSCFRFGTVQSAAFRCNRMRGSRSNPGALTSIKELAFPHNPVSLEKTS